MKYRSQLVPFFILLIVLTITACRGDDKSPPETENPQYSVAELDINDFQNGSGRAVAIMGVGMTIADDADSADFTTGIVTATQPFNYVIPQWKADLPVGSALELYVRTATFAGEWGAWQPVQIDPDTSEPENGKFVGNTLDNGDALTMQDRAQLNVIFRPNADGENPVIESLAFTFLDSTDGPTTQEILSDLNPIRPGANLENQVGKYPKPTVISRQQWCTHADCNYSSGLSYYPVSHLIVHHTVSNNSTADWAGNVRAIWMYHTYRRGWGDVGYNYLIDPNGNIYEGHIGGDNVIGTHASAANRGGMGVALLGTFSTNEVPEAMKNALVELLAWKASQRNIDLWEASRMPLLDWGNLHLIGHRDVYGTTACPGDLAHNDLAQIRQRVDQKLGRTEDYAYVDERDSNFSVNNANWYDGPKNCGFNAHSLYTFSTTNASQSSNVGEWRPVITADGKYQIDAFVPFCATGQEESHQATYTISDGLGGQVSVTADHQNGLGLWVPLGEFSLRQGSNTVVRLNDLTSNQEHKPIWFDAIRYKRTDGYAEPPPIKATVTPPPTPVGDTTAPTSQITQVQQQCDGNFTLTWQGQDVGSGIKHYDIAYKRSNDSNWIMILNDTTLTSSTFTPPDQTSSYRFRAQAVDNAGNVEPFKDNGDMGSEQVVPCNIEPPINSEPATNAWGGRNTTFKWKIAVPQAVHHYELEVATDAGFNDVIVRTEVAGDRQQVTQQFDRDFDQLYWRVSAETNQNKRFTSTPTSFAIDTIAPKSAIYEAYRLENGDYKLFWDGSDEGSGIRNYTVEYLGDGADWTAVVEHTDQKTTVFHPPSAETVYLFRSRATDNAGNVTVAAAGGDFDTSIACPYIDTPPEHITPAPDSWRSNYTVVFRWAASNAEPRCTSNAGIEISADQAFNNLLGTLSDSARSSYTFTADPGLAELWWRTTYTTRLGDTFTSQPTRVRFDTTAPDTRVSTVQYSGNRYLIHAEGSDAQSGIVGYIFEYRREGNDRWVRWTTGSKDTVWFDAPDQSMYWFRSLGIDAAGNIELPDTNGDMSSAEADPLQMVFLPIIYQ